MITCIEPAVAEEFFFFRRARHRSPKKQRTAYNYQAPITILQVPIVHIVCYMYTLYLTSEEVV